MKLKHEMLYFAHYGAPQLFIHDEINMLTLTEKLLLGGQNDALKSY